MLGLTFKNNKMFKKIKNKILLTGMSALLVVGCANDKEQDSAMVLDGYKYSTNAILKKNVDGNYILEGEIKELLTGSSKKSAGSSMGLDDFPMDQRTDENAQLWVLLALLIGDDVELSRQSTLFGLVSGKGPLLCKLPVEGGVKFEMPLDHFVSQTESLCSFLAREGSVTGRLLLLGPSGKPLSECQSKSFILKIDNSKEGHSKEQSISLERKLKWMRKHALTSEGVRSDGLSASCVIDDKGFATIRLRNKSKEEVKVKFRKFLPTNDWMDPSFFRLDRIIKIRTYDEKDGKISGIYAPISEDPSKIEEKEVVIQGGKEFVMIFSPDELFDSEYHPARLVSLKSNLDEGLLGPNFFYQMEIKENGKGTTFSEINLRTKTDVNSKHMNPRANQSH